jgi:hypothetical protein
MEPPSEEDLTLLQSATLASDISSQSWRLNLDRAVLPTTVAVSDIVSPLCTHTIYFVVE